MDWIAALGIVAGMCTTISVVPQIIKALKTKEVQDVSIGMFTILIIGLLLWSIYGIIKEDMPVMIMNSIAFTLNLFMMFLILRYRNRG